MKTFQRSGLYFVCVIISVALSHVTGQEKQIILDKSITGRYLFELLPELESKYGLRFVFHEDSIPNRPIEFNADSIALNDLLTHYFSGSDIYVTTDTFNRYFFSKHFALRTGFSDSVYVTQITVEQEVIYTHASDNYIRAQQQYVGDTLIIGSFDKAGNGSKFIFSGKVSDELSKEPVIGATLYCEELKLGVVSNPSGRFKMELPAGRYVLVVSSIDKIARKYSLDIRSNGSAEIDLKSKFIELDEVSISATQFDKVKSTLMGLESLTAKEIREIPVVLGERDVLKVAQLLPGVQKIGEGSSGFNVRGSPSDQNVFYMNDIPVYNVNHMVGFFSAFHPEAVNKFNLYKSNIPAEYGGHLSSIFDIEMKKANREKFGMRGGISPISGNLLFEHPLMKNKGSVLLGGRSTYSNWLLNLIRDPEVRQSEVYFGDLLVSAEYDISPKDQLQLFGYYSYDRINFNNEIEHEYSNAGAAMNWNHRINEKSNVESSWVFSRYSFDELNRELAYDLYRHNYYIQHYQINNRLIIRPHPRHRILAGADLTLYDQSRGKHFILQNNQVLTNIDLGIEQALETGIYLSDEWKINQKLDAYIGIRYNRYNYLGPRDVFQYRSEDYNQENITDTLSYGRWETIKSYGSPDLRLGFKYMPTPSFSIKLSYNQLKQYIFMLTNSLSVSPSDKWKLADPYIKPLSGQQISLGMYFNSAGRKWEYSAETYVKDVANLVEYKDGADLLITQIPETEVLQGDLMAYGLELMVQRNTGKLTGWLNYSFTKTRVEVKSRSSVSHVNNGMPFPANYDKPHSVNLVSNYRFRKRLSLSFNLVYSSGHPFTIPVSVYYLNNNPVINYSNRNEYRVPDYFRVDMSVNLEGNLVRKKIAHGSWMFSAYNLTGRKNAYSVYFKAEDNTIKGYKLSIFGAPIFTVAYVFKLGNYND